MSFHSLNLSAPSLDRTGDAPGRPILAIDYGRRRMGLALSDALGVTAQPLEVWTRLNRRRDITRLREICRRHKVGRILVGWPLRLDGSAGEMAQETERFAERLRRELGLTVELVDERLTSWEAQQVMEGTAGKKRGPRARTAMDDVAAAIILREYLARARHSQE